MFYPAKQHFQAVIELPVLTQLKQPLSDENQQRSKQRHGISFLTKRPAGREILPSQKPDRDPFSTGAISLWPVIW